MQAVASEPNSEAAERLNSGLRHVAILFSDIAGFEDYSRKLGDAQAAQFARRFLTIEEMVITRDGLGEVLHFGGDSIFAVFDQASVALNRALEIQRLLDPDSRSDAGQPQPQVRIGLHMGEVLFQQGERRDIISRHVTRARAIMEAAAPGQILASDAVVDAARDFIDLPRERQAIRHYGEFYFKGVGATGLWEVADLRFRTPQAPPAPQADQAESALVGRLELAGYRCGARIGEGAFGVVYRAEQEATGKTVAIKVFNPALVENQAARERFTQESERAQRLGLPEIARVVEQQLDHQPPFLAMELVDGRPLDAALAGAAPDRIARIFRGLCAVLSQAHAAGVVHGGLKPGNVLIREDDSIVIMDFGLVALGTNDPTSSGPNVSSSTGVPGNPAYLAPEVIQCGPRTAQADIYSLGALLFKVLTGREPFAGPTVHQIIQAQLYEDPPLPAALKPQVADGLQRVCLKALEKVPADRYESARNMAQDLERFLGGEVVRTRPTAYDNLLFHRVQKHVEQIQQWSTRGLLSAEESHRLLGSYEGLQRRGLPAVMEGRQFRLWQTLVYIGGWAVVNGALLWLMQHWDSLSRAGKLCLGAMPALTTFTLAVAMWRFERFRLFFVALVVGVLATPLWTGVWLHEFKVAASVPGDRLALEIFHSSNDSQGMTNEQILLTALVTLIVAGAVMSFTRTTTHSAQAVAALALFYTACLLGQGLRAQVEQNEWATLALKFIPLWLAVCLISSALLRYQDRYYQAPPWVYFASALILVILCAVSLHGLNEWSRFAPEIRRPLACLLFSCAGIIAVVAGVAARNFLKHRCRSATLAVIFLGLVAVLAGLGLAGWQGTWPAGWLRFLMFGKGVPLPHAVLPLAALLITLLACRYQMLSFLMVGLAGLAFSIHGLGQLYFEDAPAWPKVLMSLGAICFFAALYLELNRTRGNTIDDVVSEKRL